MSFNEEQFLSDMSENMATDSDQNFESFIQSFVKVFDKHAPRKTKRVRKKKPAGMA